MTEPPSWLKVPQLSPASASHGVDQFFQARCSDALEQILDRLDVRQRDALCSRGLRHRCLGGLCFVADRVLSQKHGAQYAEAFHHIGGSSRNSTIEEYIKINAVPLEYAEGASWTGLFCGTRECSRFAPPGSLTRHIRSRCVERFEGIVSATNRRKPKRLETTVKHPRCR